MAALSYQEKKMAALCYIMRSLLLQKKMMRILFYFIIRRFSVPLASRVASINKLVAKK
jgi:hypothetical protein